MDQMPLADGISCGLPARGELLRRLRQAATTRWDVIVVGGGATGLGVAVDAATRGWRTLLLEAHDFASGTSSKATKLLHGGVRYLAQGNVALVREALHERDTLLRNAPGLSSPLEFVIPTYRHRDRLFYGAGMKVYDALAGRLSLARSRQLDAAQTLAALPTLQGDGLKGGVCYVDGQFDDARLALALAATAHRAGALVANYVSVQALLKDGSGKVIGVQAREQETAECLDLHAACVVNATGVWADGLRQSDNPGERPMILPSQGAHVVLDRSFLPGHQAMLVPKTPDGRVLFMVPWLGRTLVGTTDTPRPDVDLGGLAPSRHSASHTPVPFEQEVAFILETARPYLTRRPTRADVRSAWAGLRPLVTPAQGKGHNAKVSSKVSREHTVAVAPSGLLTVTGGKWTTYRRMAETVLDTAIGHGLLDRRPCTTAGLRLSGAHVDAAPVRDAPPALDEASVVHAVRSEGALTVEDVLARRHRLLLLDARAARDEAPAVAAIMARERGLGTHWAEGQVRAFHLEAAKYMV